MKKKAPFEIGREAPHDKAVPSASVLGAIHNSRPILEFVIDFIVNRGIAPHLQRAMDEEEIDFSVEEYMNDKRFRKQS